MLKFEKLLHLFWFLLAYINKKPYLCIRNMKQ